MSRTRSSGRTVRLGAIALMCGVATAVPAQAQAFNPQPDPPRVAAQLIVDPAVIVGFNPQPDPPRVLSVTITWPPGPTLPSLVLQIGGSSPSSTPS